MQTKKPSLTRRVVEAMGWTRSSYYLMSAFLLLVFLIAYIWWPLAEEALVYVDWNGPWWLHFDWLLVGIFLVMSLLIMAGADLKVDAWIVFVGFIGGLVIESWVPKPKSGGITLRSDPQCGSSPPGRLPAYPSTGWFDS